jgi:hypothetical protein
MFHEQLQVVVSKGYGQVCGLAAPTVMLSARPRARSAAFCAKTIEYVREGLQY